MIPTETLKLTNIQIIIILEYKLKKKEQKAYLKNCWLKTSRFSKRGAWNMDIQIHEAQRIPRKISSKKNAQLDIMIGFSKSQRES